MRVLVGHNRYTAHGGEDTVFAAEVALLEANGHTVITFKDSNERIETMNLAVAAARSIWSRESRLKLRKLIATEKPDVAHFHNTFALISPSAYYACRAAGVPVVQTLHNYRLLCPAAYLMRNGSVCEKCLKKTFKWPAIVHGCYDRSRLKSADVAIMLAFHRMLKTWQRTVSGYIALTRFAKAKFVEGGLPPDKIFVKPNFIDGGLASQPSEHRDYLLFIGRLSGEKGLNLLIEAMTIARHVPIKIIGDGPLAQSIDEQIQQRGLKNVERLGQLPYPDVLRQLDAAACLVMPSIWYEGFPMTIVEAFSRGVPVIASRLGSMAEIVEDNVTGLHFAAGDATELADRIGWAWANKMALRKMGQRAFQVFTDQYDAGRNHEMLMAIYQDVIDRAPTRPAR